MSRKFIVLGDTTTHGGTVITAWGAGRWTIDGKPVACIGDKVFCPLCKGVYTIVEGASDPDTTLDGKNVAREFDGVDCGAKLVSVGQSRASHSA
jgi:uncharacterized Zn-binding protein involved in type VI secretion